MIYFWFDQYNEDRASHRLRALIPCKALQNIGLKSKIISNQSELTEKGIVIFSKDSALDSMLTVKKLGYVVGFDLCDDYFNEPERNFVNFCNEAHFITANSNTMKLRVKEITGKDSFYLVDPHERNLVSPTFKNTEQKLNLIWYGSKASLKFVDWNRLIERLENNHIEYHLNICSTKVEKILRQFKNHTNISLITWSWEKHQQLVDNADIVFIPLNFYEGVKNYSRLSVKSHNRIVDGLAQGKWVISSPLPSYIPLKDFCWLGDPIDGINFFVNNKKKVQKKIIAGQDWIRNNASPTIAATQLKNIYEYFLGK